MLYILDKYIEKNNWIYLIYETHTESVERATIQKVRKIIKACNTETVNFDLINNQVEIKSSTDDVALDNTYIMLNRLNNETFKLVSSEGFISYVDKRRLKYLVHNNLVQNCVVEGRKIKSIYDQDINTRNELRQEIESKYNLFILKSRLLGYNITFDYEIDGEDVKITKYTGTSKKIILPNFITTIGHSAFRKKRNRSSKLK